MPVFYFKHNFFNIMFMIAVCISWNVVGIYNSGVIQGVRELSQGIVSIYSVWFRDWILVLVSHCFLTEMAVFITGLGTINGYMIMHSYAILEV